jgi:bifunctional DNA-binding transcriptional regulator/antitoxin component of YhaV-PrlF toxin-antitoxin module
VAKVTSKLQVTVPKVLAEQYGIEPGSEIEWQAAGDAIRILPLGHSRGTLDRAERLAQFDEATRRQQGRQQRSRKKKRTPKDRGWTREELYVRGSTR